jgi:hypothetical protein
MPPSHETFFAQRHRRFGSANPELMNLEYWLWMVREGINPYEARVRLGLEHESFNGPDWCFDRMGISHVELPGGIRVSIAGEHEDFYDPDFCIYNDVIVRGPGDEVQIFGYPEDLFPPTDFHSATLVGDRIIIIGRLGYAGTRLPGTTPVYVLDCQGFRIEPLKTSGDCLGWIFKHEAICEPDSSSILVRGGELITSEDPAAPCPKNLDEFRLHLPECRWERVTDRRHWRQFLLEPADETAIPSFNFRDPTVFSPKRLPFEIIATTEYPTADLLIHGAHVQCIDEHLDARIVIQGRLDDSTVDQFLDDVIDNIDRMAGQKWKATELHARTASRPA